MPAGCNHGPWPPPAPSPWRSRCPAAALPPAWRAHTMPAGRTSVYVCTCTVMLAHAGKPVTGRRCRNRRRVWTHQRLCMQEDPQRRWSKPMCCPQCLFSPKPLGKQGQAGPPPPHPPQTDLPLLQGIVKGCLLCLDAGQLRTQLLSSLCNKLLVVCGLVSAGQAEGTKQTQPHCARPAAMH